MLPANPTSLELAGWIGCLFFLAAGWNQVEKFFDRRANRGSSRLIQPQPLEVARVDPPVAESVCLGRHKSLAAELGRLNEELATRRLERRTEVGELQQQINKVDREVGELRASMELTNQQLMRIDAKLDRVIERQKS